MQLLRAQATDQFGFRLTVFVYAHSFLIHTMSCGVPGHNVRDVNWGHCCKTQNPPIRTPHPGDPTEVGHAPAGVQVAPPFQCLSYPYLQPPQCHFCCVGNLIALC